MVESLSDSDLGVVTAGLLCVCIRVKWFYPRFYPQKMQIFTLIKP